MSPFPPEDLRRISPTELAAAGLADWRLLGGLLQAHFRTPSFAVGVTIVQRIGAEADRVEHHPDVDLRYGSLWVRMSSHDVAGITARDVRLAHAISEIASELGATAQPDRLQSVGVTVHTADDATEQQDVAGFWRVALGLVADTDAPEVLRHPNGSAPTVVLTAGGPSASGATPGGVQVDVEMSAAEVTPRLQALLDAGGRLVSLEPGGRAVVADPIGNTVTITGSLDPA